MKATCVRPPSGSGRTTESPIALTAPIGAVRLFGELPTAGLPPALWLLGTLAGALGLALVAVSSLAPLVRSWLARPFIPRGMCRWC